MHTTFDATAPKALGVNISAAAEAGVARVVNEAEHRIVEGRAEAAMLAWNGYSARHGSVSTNSAKSDPSWRSSTSTATRL